MSLFEDMLQNIVNLSSEDKIQMALDSMIEMGPTFKKLDPKGSGNVIVYTLIGTAVAADGKLSQGEYNFLTALFESLDIKMSDDELIALIKATSSKEAYDFINSLKSYLTNDGIVNIVKIVAALCSIDDRISKEEAAYIASLLSD